MQRWLGEEEFGILAAACERMFPAQGDNPGATALGVAEYIDGLLGAFLEDPPRIWARGPTSGRHGGAASFGMFHRLSRLDQLAWRTRIEGSRGIAEREFNGPVTGFQEIYRRGLQALGSDFPGLEADQQRARLEADAEFCGLLFRHGCEGMYGAPEYGGNRDGAGWRAARFPGDVQPRGWSDEEVSLP